MRCWSLRFCFEFKNLEIWHVNVAISHSQTEDVFTTGGGHFLQTASCHKYELRWLERKREKQMNKQIFTHYYLSFTHWCFFETSSSNVVSQLLKFFSLLSSFLMFLCLFFFRILFYLLVPRARLDTGLYKMWQNTNILKICWDVWFCVHNSYF